MLGFLPIQDIQTLSLTNQSLNWLMSIDIVWLMLYRRDFKTLSILKDALTIKQQYYIRKTSILSTIDRVKTLNNMT